MSRMRWVLGVLILSVALMSAISMAEEQGSATVSKESGEATQDYGGTATASATATSAPMSMTSSTPAAVASEGVPAATPAASVMPPAIKPIVISFSGEAVSKTEATASAPAKFAVQDRYGVKKEIACPAESKFSPEGKSWADLKVGDKLTVEYVYNVASGERTAQVITIGESASTPAAAQ